jgi:S1-C subfamily serine protease
MRATLLTLIGLAATACGLILAPAGLASAADSAVATIGLLEAQGFDVKVDRVGSAPLSDCVVTNVRNPRERTEFVPVLGDRDRHGVVPVVVDRTVTVSLDCSRR